MTKSGDNRKTAEAAARRGGFTLIELALVLVVIAILAAIALPSYTRIKEKAKEAELKANLHNIQLGIERFAVDSAGEYPPYLIGGNNRWMEVRIGANMEKSIVVDETPVSGLSDPLLRGGYLESYPRNPFVRNTDAVLKLQSTVGDPLRSSYPYGRTLGTRFGAYGDVMGQTLCEARWLTWLRTDPTTGNQHVENTWANIQYEFYDAWIGNRSRPYLPGSFMYKSIGEIVPSGEHIDLASEIQKNMQPGQYSTDGKTARETTYPISISNYMLSAWGGARSKGLDLLGEEPMVIFAMKKSRRQIIPGMIDQGQINNGRVTPGDPATVAGTPSDMSLMLGLPAWTRGVNRSHVGPLWGSPYGPSRVRDEQVSYGNANGMRDGLIMLLTTGQE